MPLDQGPIRSDETYRPRPDTERAGRWHHRASPRSAAERAVAAWAFDPMDALSTRRKRAATRTTQSMPTPFARPQAPAALRPPDLAAARRDVPLVLVADDHDDSRDIARLVLESAGYRVIEARTGLEVLT